MSVTLSHISYKRFLFNLLGYVAIWVILQTIVLIYSVGLLWMDALRDAVMTHVLLVSCGYIMITIMRYYQPRQSLRFFWGVGISVACVLTMKAIVVNFFDQDPAYVEFFRKSMLIRGLFIWLIINIATLAIWMWSYMKEQNEMEIRKAHAEKLSREAELSRLRQQLQPHFLFNSLNSISALAGTRPDQARAMIQQLSDFLRGTIKRDDQQLVTLEEELKHLQLYLDIEKVRFGHRLKTEIEKDPKADEMTLPSLLLQPIVENAIKFGLYDTTGEITIKIITKVLDGELFIQVENPFDPTTAQPRQGTGFGLTAVQRRLYLLYARQDLMTTQQQTGEHPLFITQLKVPQQA
jgi:hypothetical protein